MDVLQIVLNAISTLATVGGFVLQYISMKNSSDSNVSISIRQEIRIEQYEYREPYDSNFDMTSVILIMFFSYFMYMNYAAEISIVLSILILAFAIILFYCHHENFITDNEYLLLILDMAINSVSLILFYFSTKRILGTQASNSFLFGVLEAMGIALIIPTFIFISKAMLKRERLPLRRIFLSSVGSLIFSSGCIYGIIMTIIDHSKVSL